MRRRKYLFPGFPKVFAQAFILVRHHLNLIFSRVSTCFSVDLIAELHVVSRNWFWPRFPASCLEKMSGHLLTGPDLRKSAVFGRIQVDASFSLDCKVLVFHKHAKLPSFSTEAKFFFNPVSKDIFFQPNMKAFFVDVLKRLAVTTVSTFVFALFSIVL